MKKQITLALAALALLTGGILTRSWAVSWPQSAFREWQTGFNPVETLLTPLPDLYWWSQDVSVTDLALARGREWSPVAIDFGIQGLPDPIIAVGRRNELVFYHPNLPQGLSAGAALPVGTVTFPGTGGAATETGILTTNPVAAISPAAPTSTTATPAQPTPGQPTATSPPQLLFVTYGLGLQSGGKLTADDPAYVQAVSVTSSGGSFTATPLGRLKIQQPRSGGAALETRVTGMTYADIGDSANPLPFLFLTTADGQVICVDTRPFQNTTAGTAVDPAKAIRWRWIQPGPRITVPAAGGTPPFPPTGAVFAPIPFNDGMNPAVGQVALNGLPDLPSLSDSARKTNQNWQTQVQSHNQEWMVFVADRVGNGWAIEAFGETKNSSTKPGQQATTLTGKAKTRWQVKIPGGGLFPDRFAVPPVFWNGNTPMTDASGNLTGQNDGWKDLVVFAGYGNLGGQMVGRVAAYDAQGNFLTADRPVFWDTSKFPPGVPPSIMAGTTLPPVTRKLGDADGTTQMRWQFPEAGANAPVYGRFPVTVIRAMTGWIGPRLFNNNGQDFANTEDDDDRIFIRWNETYVRGIDRTTAAPTEPVPPAPYVERLGSLAAYGSVETTQPIDNNQPVTVTFKKTVMTATTTYTVPPQYVSILPQWTDSSSTDPNNRPNRGRITITKPVGLDNKDQPVALSPGDQITIQYTPQGSSSRRTEANVTYPSRLGREVELAVAGRSKPTAGTVVPTSIGVNAVTIEEEGTASPTMDEFITPQLTDDNYNPPVGNVTRSALNPGMSIANDNLYFGSRYRGRLYVIEAVSLLLRGELVNSDLENPVGGQATPGANDSIPTAIAPIGSAAIADGWMYTGYGNGFVAAYANFSGGGLGTDIQPPVGPFSRQGSRRSSIPEPEIRVTDTGGTPITDENRLRFDWGQPVNLAITFQIPADSGDNPLNLWTNPVRITIRGPMGDLPPVTVSPARKTQSGNVAGVATVEVTIPNATPSNPMTPGTPLLSETPVARRAGTAHWELRAEQIGTNWARPNPTAPNDRTQDIIGPWEPDREAATWDPAKNTAPWFTLNNPIALVYQPSGAAVDVGLVPRFATAPAGKLFEGKNGDPYPPGQTGDVKQPKVITVGVDPANQRQLLFAEHGKTSPAMVLGIVDRSDLGLRPNLGSLKVRVQLPKVTKLGFPLMSPGEQATGVPYGSVDQNEPDDGPDGYYPSIPGERLNVVKQADASNAATGAVALRGAVGDPASVGADGYETKVLQPELFNLSIDVPPYQPDGVYATRARLTDPQTVSSTGAAVPSPATAVDPRAPYRDYAPDDPNADLNNPPFAVGLNDRTTRVTVFIDANNNGKLDLQGNYREAYRTFVVQVAVRPDMRLQTLAVSPRTGALSRLMDLGKIWQGFQTPTWGALGSLNTLGRTFFEQYWKPFVIQNTGNVNLVRVKPEVMLSAGGTPVGPVRLPSDSVDLYDSLTLARDPAHSNVNLSDANQIYLRTSFDDSLGLGQGQYGKGGVWLQKARPGASSPGTGLFSGNPVAPNSTQYEPKLTLNIPMGTPLGTYAGDVRFFNDRQVVVVQDASAPLGFKYVVQPAGNNGLLDRQLDPATGQLAALEPYSDPTMSVKVRVTEDVAAGSTADPNVLSQAGLSSGGALTRTAPGAGLDMAGKKMLLFYASNQEGLKASQPMRFDIFGTAVTYSEELGTFPFDPTPLSGTVWSTPVRLSDQATAANALVKNTKPSFAQDPRPNGGAGYVFWQEDQTDASGQNQARILYRQVTPPNSLGGVQILAPGGRMAETGAVREAPRAVAVPLPNGLGLRWFVFWNGSEQQKGNLIFSQSADPSNPASWTAETVVPTSPSLATASNASPVYIPSTGTLWLFYNGFSQRLGRSDVYATKLDPTTLGTRQTAVAAGPAAQIGSYGLLGLAPKLGDILRANPTRTVFTATGVDWRVDSQNPLAIFINGYVPLADRSGPPTPPDGLELYLNGKQISTIYRGPAANGEQNWSFQAPLKDGSRATVYLAVDTAAGTIRFSQPPGNLMLPGWKDTLHQDPQVVADYIPGSLRLTSSELGATGGVGFVTSTYEPSWYWNTLDLRQPPAQRAIKPGAAPFGARADRLWSVWRRAGSATTLGPTLYYKAFRPGLQLITPLRGTTAGGNFYTFTIASADGKSSVPVLQDADEQDGVLWFRQEDEGRKVSVTRRDLAGGQVTETHYIGWREEGNEAPVPMDVSVNEGTVSAFPTIDVWNFVPVVNSAPQGAQAQLLPHLENLWLFWTSTRGAGSDIFHATIAPRLTPLPG